MSAFLAKLQALNRQFCQKKFHWKYFSISLSTTYKHQLMKEIFKEDSKMLLCYSRCIVLRFQWLLFVRLTDRWSTFYETMIIRLNGEHVPSYATNKK